MMLHRNIWHDVKDHFIELRIFHLRVKYFSIINEYDDCPYINIDLILIHRRITALDSEIFFECGQNDIFFYTIK